MMIRTFVLGAALAALATAATAQNPHAGHAGHAGTSSPAATPSRIVTTPADGAMTHGSPERFTIAFPHPMILKTVTLTAEGREPIVVTAPAASAAATTGVALPRLSPGSYAAAWVAQGADGHTMSGSVRFMVH